MSSRISAEISGRLLGGDGEPLPGIDVRCRWIEKSRGRFAGIESESDRSVGTTDEQGRFRCRGVPADHKRMFFAVRVPGYPDHRWTVAPLEAGEHREGVLLRLDGGAKITGIVLNADGAPIAGIPVLAHSLEENVRPAV